MGYTWWGEKFMRKNISVTNERVLEAMAQADNASRLIEDAVIYYLDSIEKEYITKEEVSNMILDALKNVEIKNPNYSQEQLGNDITSILEL